MKIVAMIARYLLGIMFTVFGLNGFFHFIPMPPMTGLAGQFMGAMVASNYVLGVCFFEVAGGLLFLIGRYVRLGIVCLGPVIVNILLYHLTMDHKGLLMALVVAILWLLVLLRDRAFIGEIFAARTPA